jgi:adenylyltransferase/sulfurtransferase
MNNAINIPVARLSARMSSLDPGVEYVVFCRSGVRSARALTVLQASGFEKVRHLEGGLLRWAQEIDANMVIV